MVLNFPAPHGPEDAHPDYRHFYDEPNLYQQSILNAHRQLVFNRTSWQPGEKHWFLTSQKEMTEVLFWKNTFAKLKLNFSIRVNKRGPSEATKIISPFLSIKPL